MVYSLFPINVLEELKKDLYRNTLKNMLYDLRWPVRRIYNLIQKSMKIGETLLQICKRNNWI
jgi:hypothetical protein